MNRNTNLKRTISNRLIQSVDRFHGRSTTLWNVFVLSPASSPLFAPFAIRAGQSEVRGCANFFFISLHLINLSFILDLEGNLLFLNQVGLPLNVHKQKKKYLFAIFFEFPQRPPSTLCFSARPLHQTRISFHETICVNILPHLSPSLLCQHHVSL